MPLSQAPVSDVKWQGRFHLPGVLLGRRSPGKHVVKTGMSATSARRVVTFLPPPMDTVEAAGTRGLFTGQEMDAWQSTAVMYPCLSPTRSPSSTSSPLKGAQSTSLNSSPAAAGAMESITRTSFNPLSPPPSDEPQQSLLPETPKAPDNGEGENREEERGSRTAADINGIRRRHASMKALVREVRISSVSMWILAELWIDSVILSGVCIAQEEQ